MRTRSSVAMDAGTRGWEEEQREYNYTFEEINFVDKWFSLYFVNAMWICDW